MPFPLQHASGQVQVALLAAAILLTQVSHSETPLDEAATSPGGPEVWLCAGDRIVELLCSEAE